MAFVPHRYWGAPSFSICGCACRVFGAVSSFSLFWAFLAVVVGWGMRDACGGWWDTQNLSTLPINRQDLVVEYRGHVAKGIPVLTNYSRCATGTGTMISCKRRREKTKKKQTKRKFSPSVMSQNPLGELVFYPEFGGMASSRGIKIPFLLVYLVQFWALSLPASFIIRWR